MKNYVRVGVDEAGRGALAGPVVAAAVILPSPCPWKAELKDSKILTPEKRYQLRSLILTEAVDWGLGILWPHEIDQLNIANAAYLAMRQAILELRHRPDEIIVDGPRFPFTFPSVRVRCVVKADATVPEVSAASILAKTFRDDIMQLLHHLYPQYKWNSNKGYPTLAHRSAIVTHHITPLHRRSFTLFTLFDQPTS